MFKVEVIADNSGKWCGNGMTFPTQEAAEEYGRDLSWRWTAVREWRVVPVAPVVTREELLDALHELVADMDDEALAALIESLKVAQ